MTGFTCEASVYRADWDAEDACDLPATGYVWDVEFGGDWPACSAHRDRNTGIRADLVDLIARRPELRDVGIAGYLVDSALNDEGGAMPKFRSYLVFVDLARELEAMLPSEYALEVHR